MQVPTQNGCHTVLGPATNLLVAVASWALEFPRLIVLGDFTVHADAATLVEVIIAKITV